MVGGRERINEDTSVLDEEEDAAWSELADADCVVAVDDAGAADDAEVEGAEAAWARGAAWCKLRFGATSRERAALKEVLDATMLQDVRISVCGVTIQSNVAAAAEEEGKK